MIRLFIKFLAILFPWIALFICDNPGGAVLALIMQVTIIGWPFAASWALRALNETYFDKNPGEPNKELSDEE